ncbi:MAG TPA: MFS transporter, partial [Haliangiales bacterium]|nr:MFS transporter [Haliangiales bacterium]
MPDQRPSHDRAFLHRRGANWLTLGLTYAAMYMARYNFAFANKSLSDEYGFSKTDIGTIITVSTLVYGLSAVFNGPIADRL